MDINEQAVHDIVTRQIDLMRYERSVRREVLKQLESMSVEINERLKLNDLNELSRRKLENLLAEIEEILSRDYDLIATKLNKANEELAEDEHHWLMWWLGGMALLYGLNEPKPIPQTQRNELAKRLMVGGLTLSEAMNRQRDDLMVKLKAAIRTGAIGQGYDEIADSVQAAFKRAKQYAETTTATWVASLSNQVMSLLGRSNKDVIKAWRHISVLDGRTSAVCLSRNGLIWDIEHNPIGHEMPFKVPPIHPNCRSRLVWLFDLKNPPKEMSGEDWVKSRSQAQLREQFGKGIGDMLYLGDISLSQAVKEGGLAPMTLTELRQKYADEISKNSLRYRYLELSDEVAKRKKKGETLEHIRETVPNDKVWKIAKLNDEAVKWLGAKTNEVWISEDTVVKQVFNHPENHIWYDWFNKADELLNHAELVAYSKESRLKLIFMKSGDDILKTVVKTTRDRKELYMVSIFKANMKEVKAAARKYDVLMNKFKLD